MEPPLLCFRAEPNRRSKEHSRRRSAGGSKGLDDTLLVLAHKLKSGIEVRKEYAQHLPDIKANGSELNQVWTNIIDNAADALEGHGEITIRTRQDGLQVVIEIEDDGPGIPAEVQSRIFEPRQSLRDWARGWAWISATTSSSTSTGGILRCSPNRARRAFKSGCRSTLRSR